MRYTVLWKPSAEGQLADIWARDPDRGAILSAAQQLEVLLRHDAEDRGESRAGGTRILIVPPLAIVFEVSEPDRMVWVLGVRRLPRHGDQG